MNETQRRRALADVKEFFSARRGAGRTAAGAVRRRVRTGDPAGRHDVPAPQARRPAALLPAAAQLCSGGEVVVFTQDDRRCTGRVAARGGDTVEVTENALLRINGSLVAEPDIYETTPRYDSDVTYPSDPGRRRVFYPLRRPRGCARQPPVRPGDGRKYRRAGHCDCEEE